MLFKQTWFGRVGRAGGGGEVDTKDRVEFNVGIHRYTVKERTGTAGRAGEIQIIIPSREREGGEGGGARGGKISMGRALLRRYLCQRLAEYYAQPADKVVGSVSATTPRCIDFSSLLNEWHWKRTYRRVYEAQQGQWLTPVELFCPHYSNTLANFVSHSMAAALRNLHRYDDGVFDVVELGGGRGTNAKALLDHLRNCHPEMYDRLQSYTIFDASPTLHELQHSVLIEGSLHSDKVNLKNIDMMDVSEGKSEFLTSSCDTPTSVIALELLDNLPHDKIKRCLDTGGVLQAVTSADDPAETTDLIDTSQRHDETFSPIDDPLLQHILSVAPSLYAPTASHGPMWVPTAALGILTKIFESRPNSSVAFADFDWLPPPSLRAGQFPSAESAVGDPLVTDMQGNDYPCYLTDPPDALCDILFPTDFGRLAKFANAMHAAAASPQRGEGGISAVAMKQSDFLLKYGPEEVRKTKGWTGYSPLIHDFGNCSVLAVTPESAKANTSI